MNVNKEKIYNNDLNTLDLKFLASHIGARIYKNKEEITISSELKISDVRSLNKADSTTITFVSSKKNASDLLKTKALACIVTKDLIDIAPENIYLLVVNNPYIAYIKIATLFHPSQKITKNRSTHYYMAETAQLGLNSEIDFGCYIGENVKIGNNVKIHPNTYIGDDVIIGNDCIIYSGVAIVHSVIGNNVIIYSGARIGQDGFGYIPEHGKHVKIPHLGKVKLGDYVEIGANTCIDRGTLDDTIIGDMCKLDNLVQIGHNAVLGKGCILVSQVGIAGSVKFGDYVSIGGQGGVAGHITVGSNTQIAAKSGVLSNVKENSVVIGYPAQPRREFWKQFAIIKKIINTKGKK